MDDINFVFGNFDNLIFLAAGCACTVKGEDFTAIAKTLTVIVEPDPDPDGGN